MADKLAGITWPENGRNVFQENFVFEQESKSVAVIERTSDHYSNGIQSGGDVSSPGISQITVSPTLAYDHVGRKISFQAARTINVANGNLTVILRHKFLETPGNPPDLTGQSVVHRSDSFDVLAVAIPLADDVPLREISVINGNVVFGNDVRIKRNSTVSGDSNVQGNADVARNLTVHGNLQVLGASSKIETSDTEIKDNLITLNKGDVGPGVTAGFSGVEVDRGAGQTKFRFGFDESLDKMVAGFEGATDELVLKNYLTTALDLKLGAAEKGAPSGVATLDALGKLVMAQIANGSITPSMLSGIIRPMEVYSLIFTPKKYTLSAAQPFFSLKRPNQIIDLATYPDLAPEMRNKKADLDINEGTDLNPIWVNYDTFIMGTSYIGNGAAVIIPVKNTPQNIILLAGLNEAKNYFGNGTFLGVFHNNSIAGNIPVNDYGIIDVDPAGLTISIASTAPSASLAGTETFCIYPHRLPYTTPGNSNDAMHWRLSELGFMVNGGSIVNGYPVRDQMQGFRVMLESWAAYDGIGVNNPHNLGYGSAGPYGNSIVSQGFTEFGYGTPRIGLKTRGPALGINVYYYCGTVVM